MCLCCSKWFPPLYAVALFGFGIAPICYGIKIFMVVSEVADYIEHGGKHKFNGFILLVVGLASMAVGALGLYGFLIKNKTKKVSEIVQLGCMGIVSFGDY